LTSLCLFFLALYLFLERLWLVRHWKRIPLRIAVTGTRGKSTVTRFIAASLRESGFGVLAKTTGSKAVIVLPDGREEEIRRMGLPTILEEKKLLERGAELGVEALVTELMSFRPESSLVESQRILRPQILVITNVRLDHREEMGWTKPEIAQSLASAIPAGAAVFLPDEEFYPEFEEAAAKMKAKIIRVKKSGAGEGGLPRGVSPLLSFEENIRLALAVSGHVGVQREVAFSGILKAEPDFGSLRIWEAELGAPPAHWLFVSAFAANEPESTACVLDRLKDELPLSGRTLVGILNFREDRGDRTMQWLRAMERGYFRDFSRLFAVGGHVHTLKVRKGLSSRPPLIPLAAKSPAAIMQEVVADIRCGAVLVGMGNMGGLGEALVANWEKIGRPHAF
jgi:gamma-polyglutamate synthase